MATIIVDAKTNQIIKIHQLFNDFIVDKQLWFLVLRLQIKRQTIHF
jgi:hypothetical protein